MIVNRNNQEILSPMKLKEWREKKGYSQRDLAKRLNTEQGHISQWEKDTMPRADFIRAIMKLSKGEVTANDFI